MALRTEEMLAAMLTSDETYNGRFITGVLTTGIYCLPSCRARKPKPENVRFFPSGEQAQAAGLRPCKKCRPDEFERGEDTELEDVERLAQAVRAEPWRFKGVPEMADFLAYGTTKLHELVRTHYHRSPGDLLAEARIEAAKQRLIQGNDQVAEVAFDVGFETLSAFNDNFRRATGMTPSSYRGLRDSPQFVVRLPSDLQLDALLQSAGRDPNSPSDRVEGRTWAFATHIDGLPATVTVRFSDSEATVEIDGIEAKAALMAEAHAIVTRVIALDQDVRAFEQQATAAGFERLVARRQGLRIPQAPQVVDGMIWSIVGQQVNLTFAFALRKRLYEGWGERTASGLFAAPTLQTLASMDPSDLVPHQYSRRKAEYLIGAAAQPVFSDPDIHLRSATRLERELLAVRGLGPWSANYVMMRSLGLLDCVPYGDTGLLSGLCKLYDLDERPDVRATKRLMEPFAPYRSLATFHLWQSLKEPS